MRSQSCGQPCEMVTNLYICCVFTPNQHIQPSKQIDFSGMLSYSRTCTRAFYFLLKSTNELHVIPSNAKNILTTRSFVSNETEPSNRTTSNLMNQIQFSAAIMGSHTYLDQLNNLKFDESDPNLGSNNGELSCIFALITGDNVEFNLHANHGLRELVRDWLLDSTAPVL